MKVNHVEAARGSKKNPWVDKKCQKCGKEIKKGEPYKWFSAFRSKYKNIACKDCHFSRGQMQGGVKGEVMDAFDSAIETLNNYNCEEGSGPELRQEIEDAISMITEAADAAAEQYRSVSDEHFSGGGPMAELADEMESVSSELGSIAVDIEDEETWANDDFDTYADYLAERRDEYVSEIEGADSL